MLNVGHRIPVFTGTPQGKFQYFKRDIEPGLKALYPADDQNELKSNADKFERQIQDPQARTNSAVLLKQAGINGFLVWERPNGFSERGAQQGQSSQSPNGLFYHDTQHLDQFAMQVPGQKKGLQLAARKVTPDQAEYRYTHPEFPALGIQRRERLWNSNLQENIRLTNNGAQPLTVEILLGSQAKDSYESRWHPHNLKQDQSTLVLNRTYRPAKIYGTAATLTADINPRGKQAPGNTLRTRIVAYDAANPNAASRNIGMTADPENPEKTVKVTVTIPPAQEGKAGQVDLGLRVSPFNALSDLQPDAPLTPESWRASSAKLSITPGKQGEHLPNTLATASDDLLRLLVPVRCEDKTLFVPAAGYPNFGRPFGRDSLITAMESLQTHPRIAADVLQVMAHYQGKKDDIFTEEAPGKMLHEYSYGEPARQGILPHHPYYGSEDSTPLFVMLMSQYIRRTNDLALMEQLWSNLEKALDWMERQAYGQENPAALKGFLPQRKGAFGRNIDMITSLLHGEAKQGTFVGLRTSTWKDHKPSFQLVPDENGKLGFPPYPIAPAELQGYLYGAWQGAAELYEKRAALLRQSGRAMEAHSLAERAEALQQWAADLKEAFNRRFWMPQERFMAIALDGQGKQVDAVASNGAQALWSGIVDEQKAPAMLKRLGEKDLLSGWGLRSLSEKHPAYNPIAYHTGAVWVHDSALVAEGVKRHYGHLRESGPLVKNLTNQLLQAAQYFDYNRFPEVHAGFEREKQDRNIMVYPDTCVIQAWSAAAPLQILSTLLGLQVDAATSTVTLRNPTLPDGVKQLKLTDLPVGNKKVYLLLEKQPFGHVKVMPQGELNGVKVRILPPR